MAERPTSIAAPLLGTTLLCTATGFLGTLVTLRLAGDGVPVLLIGLVITAYFVGIALGCRFMLGVVSRYGHSRSFAAFSALLTASVLALSLTANPWLWLVLRACAGGATAGLFIVTESWLNQPAKPRSSGKILAIYMVIGQLALCAGQGFLAPFDFHSHEPFVVAAMLCAFAALPFSLQLSHAPSAVVKERMPLGELFRLSPLGVVGAAMGGALVSAVLCISPLFAHLLGLHPERISFYMVVLVGAGAVLVLPLGWLSTKVGRRPVLIAVCVVAAAASLVHAGRLEWRDDLLILAALQGACVVMIHPLSASLTHDQLQDWQALGANAALAQVFALGGAIGPLLSTAFVALFEVRGHPYFMALSSVALGAFAAARMFMRFRVPAPQRSAFVPLLLPTTAPGATELVAWAARGEAGSKMLVRRSEDDITPVD